MMLQCWNENPDSRPYFSDIVLRLQRMLEDSQVTHWTLFSNVVTCTKIKMKITGWPSNIKLGLLTVVPLNQSHRMISWFSGYENNKITINFIKWKFLNTYERIISEFKSQ